MHSNLYLLILIRIVFRIVVWGCVIVPITEMSMAIALMPKYALNMDIVLAIIVALILMRFTVLVRVSVILILLHLLVLSLLKDLLLRPSIFFNDLIEYLQALYSNIWYWFSIILAHHNDVQHLLQGL